MSEKPLTTQTLWESFGVNTGDTLWFLSIGILLQGMVLSSILSKTIRYFEKYQRRDKRWLAWAIGFGCVVAGCTLFITCAQAYVVIYRETLDISPSMRYLILGDISHFFIGTLFHLATGICFAWRAYEMYGNNRWVLLLFSALLGAQFLTSMVVIGHGYRLPALTGDGLSALPPFLDKSATLLRIWGILTLAIDATICVFMLYLLIISNDSLFNRESKIYNKMVPLIHETILLPVICLIIFAVPNRVDRNPQVDVRRVLTCLMPVLYYHSTLHTLVHRHFVKKVVTLQIAGDGVNVLVNENVKYDRKSEGGHVVSPTSGAGSGALASPIYGNEVHRGIYDGPFMKM